MSSTSRGVGLNTYTACALLGNDDETLCNTARWFMKEYQFVTDGYRLFSALNRLSDSEHSWFNCGPSQKFILRQLKAVDFSLLGDARRKSLFQERASYTTKDDNGNQIRAREMDVALLMLYGHVLYAGRSYAYAVSTSEPLSKTWWLIIAIPDCWFSTQTIFCALSLLTQQTL